MTASIGAEAPLDQLWLTYRFVKKTLDFPLT